MAWRQAALMINNIQIGNVAASAGVHNRPAVGCKCTRIKLEGWGFGEFKAIG